ncbi:MAG: hypothetical protein GX288_03285 [Clostridiales bacterium]|nr:hypothetical protein [Clostridiales bacterium]
MKAKKILGLILSTTILAQPTLALASNSMLKDRNIKENMPVIENVIAYNGITNNVDSDYNLTEKTSYYSSFSGTVIEINETDDKDLLYVLVEDEEGNHANLVLSENTYYINDEKIQVGSQITGYYDATAMMIMIYPPQYSIVVAVVENQEVNLKADDFSNISYYDSFTGTVKEIIELENSKASKLHVVDDEGMEAVFIVTDKTYKTSSQDVRVGSLVTGYYDNRLMRIMIYPPQYELEVLDIKKEEYNIKVDYFNKDLISSDGMLQLHLKQDTEIVYPDGTQYEGNPVRERLVIIYDVSTRSIPAQTLPKKVIVLPK